MKARAIVMTLALGLVGAAVCFAADGFLGTWKLNEAKSKLAPGTAKNSTVVYSTMGDNMMVTIDGTDAAEGTDSTGKKISATAVYDKQ